MKLKPFCVRPLMMVALLVSCAIAALAGDPGIPIPQGSVSPVTNDQQRGFLLIYNVYTSSLSNPATQNTRFSITNTNDERGIAVHLYFVDGASCSIADRYVCLTPNQTSVFTASEQDPGTTGYLVAVTTNADGFPTNFDYLIGDAFVKFENGYFGNLGAEAIPSQLAVPAISGDGTLSALSVAGLPRVLAVDNIGSRADGNETLLVVNGVGGNFTQSATTIGALFGILYDDAEQAHSWNRSGGCQLIATLNNDFPKTAPRFDVVIPAGQTGWMKFWSTSTIDNRPFGTAADGRALLGAAFRRNSTVASSAGAFQGAHNLHKLNLVGTPPPVLQPIPFEQQMASGAQQLGTQITFFVFPIFPNNCGFILPQ